MKKRILVVTLLIMGSLVGGLAVSEYRQRAAIIISYDVTEYDNDGTISDTSKIVRICRQGEWSETQILANGNLRPSHGKVTPRDETLASFPDASRREILDRTVVVLSDRRSDVWYDPSLHQPLKIILYTDDTRQTVQMVREAVEIKG